MIKQLLFIFVIPILIILSVAYLINQFLTDNTLGDCITPTKTGICKSADVIVAVSGGDTLSRAQEAIDLYKKGWGNKIIFSGASADTSGPSNALTMKELALQSGINGKDIIVDETSKNTRENADHTVKILHKIGARNIILVSSPYHLRRVYFNFTNIDNSLNYRTAAAEDQAWSYWYLKPSGWFLAITEIIGLIRDYLGLAL